MKDTCVSCRRENRKGRLSKVPMQMPFLFTSKVKGAPQPVYGAGSFHCHVCWDEYGLQPVVAHPVVAA